MKKGKNLLKRGMALILSFLMVVSVIPTDGIKIAKAAVTDTTSVSYAIIKGVTDVASVNMPTKWDSENATLTEVTSKTRDLFAKTMYVKLNSDVTESNFGKLIEFTSGASYSRITGTIVFDFAGHKIDRTGMTKSSNKNAALVFSGVENVKVTSSVGRGLVTGVKQDTTDDMGTVYLYGIGAQLDCLVENIDIKNNTYDFTGKGDIYPLEIRTPKKVVVNNVTVKDNACVHSEKTVPWAAMSIESSENKGIMSDSVSLKGNISIENNLSAVRNNAASAVDRGIVSNINIDINELSSSSSINVSDFKPFYGGETIDTEPMFTNVSGNLLRCFKTENSKANCIYKNPNHKDSYFYGKTRKVSFYKTVDDKEPVKEVYVAPYTLIDRPNVTDEEGNKILNWYFKESGNINSDYDFDMLPEELSIDFIGADSIVLYGKAHIHTGGKTWLTDSNKHWHKCTVDGCFYENGIYDQGEHDLKSVTEIVKESTGCGSIGVKATMKKCSVCGYVVPGSRTESEYEAHTDIQTIVEKEEAASCKKPGQKITITKCMNCGKELNRVVEDYGKLPHTPGNTTVENHVDGTCTVDESWDEVVRCTVCGTIIKSDHKTVAAKGHQPGMAHQENVKDADCENPGGYDIVSRCTVCNEIVSSKHYEGEPAKGHQPGQTQRENVVDVTCTTDGSYDDVIRCTVCNKVISSEHHVIECTGHDNDEGIRSNVVPATCTKDGSYDITYTCKRCSETTVETNVVEKAKGHQPGMAHIENKVDVTCTTDGSYDVVSRCNVCNEILSSSHYEDKCTGHDFSNGNPRVTWSEDNKTATLTITCSRCGDREYTANVTYAGTATCTTPGKVIYSAKFNDSELDREYLFDKKSEVEALGHDMETIPYKKATCHEEGNKEYYHCKRCDNYYSDINGIVPTTPDMQILDVDTLSGHKGVLVRGYPSTCVDYGMKSHYRCEICGCLFETEDGSKYDEANNRYVSSEITNQESLRLPMDSHSLVYFEPLRPTCTTMGHGAYYQCVKCSRYFDNAQGVGKSYDSIEQFELPMSPHQEVVHEAVPSTCVKKGNIKYYTCSVCNKFFIDDPENSGEKIEADYDNDILLDYEEHVWEDTTDKAYLKAIATCTTPTEYYQKCRNCTTKDEAHTCFDKSDMGHIMGEFVEAKEPTCIDSGNRAYYHCNICGKYFSDEAGLNEINYYPADENDTTCVYLAPKGHDFENVIDEAYLKTAATCSKPAVYYSKCKDCGAKGNTFESDIYTPHTLKYVPKKEATCTKNGNEEYWQCTECRHVFDSDIGDTPSNKWVTLYSRVIMKLGHNLETVCVTPASCSENGVYYDKCSRCDYETPEYNVEKYYHEYGEPEFTWNDDFSECKATFTCQREGCGDIQVVTLRNGDEGFVRDERGATCTEDGVVSITVTFKNDFPNVREESISEFTTNQTITETALGHEYGEYVKDNNATCVSNETETATCSRCGDTISREIEGTMTPDKHTWNTEYTVDRIPTCRNSGVESIHCKYCKKTKDHRLIPMVDHEFPENSYMSNHDATCTKDGTKTAYCKYECGTESTIVDEGSALGHDFGEYVVEREATCNQTGIKTAHCQRDGCDGEDTIVIPKLEHKYSKYTYNNDATCTKNGTETATCSLCGHKDVREKKNTATGHKYSEYVSDNNATCSKDGTKTATCSVCGNKDTIVDSGSKTGHVYENYVSDNNATCTSAGTVTGTCKFCGAKDTKAAQGSPAGHVWGTEYVVDVFPTASQDGSKSIHCTVCNAQGQSLAISKTAPNALVKADMPILLTKGVSGKKKVTLKWKKDPGAAGYDVFVTSAKGAAKYKLLKSVKGASYTHNKIGNKALFKYYVVSYKMVNGRKLYNKKSVVICTATKGNSKTNAKAVKVKKGSASLTVGKKFAIKASLKKESKKKGMLKKEALIRYVSSNKAIATVDRKGKITGQSAGNCVVYAIANNGVYKAIKVSVR